MRHTLILLLVFIIVSCTNGKQNDTTPIMSTTKIPLEIDASQYIGKDYLIDDQHSYVGFKIKYFGFSPVRGRFNTFNGTVFYNPEHLEHTFIHTKIDVRSINTGNETRDTDLLTSNGWFNAKEHPYIQFVSKEVVVQKNGNFLLKGNFSMNGITKEITITFEKPTAISRDWAENEQIDYSGTVTINRLEYGIEGGEFWDTVLENGLTQLSDEVTIELDIHTRRADYLARYKELETDNPRKLILNAFKTKTPEECLALLKQHLTSDSNNLSVGALNTIGKTLLARKQFDAANVVFEQAIHRYPESASLLENMGITQLHLNQKSNSKLFFEKAIQLDATRTVSTAYLHYFKIP